MLKDEEEALELTEKHQNIINSLEISGEKYTAPIMIKIIYQMDVMMELQLKVVVQQ